MEDELLHARHQAARLQEYRERIDPIWSDEAAREINLRYLNPHADENTLMLEACMHQLEQLSAVTKDLSVTEEAAVKVEIFVGEIIEQLDNCEQELALSHQFYEHHAQATSLAHSLFLEVEKLISKAASICEGIPKT